jgi:hypothetical protein
MLRGREAGHSLAAGKIRERGRLSIEIAGCRRFGNPGPAKYRFFARFPAISAIHWN